MEPNANANANAPLVPQGAGSPQLVNKWQSWLQNPMNRAMLMQTGIAMMQPMAPGQMPLGHFGNALAAGGELQGRVREAEEKQAKEARLALQQQQETQLRQEEARLRAEQIAQQGSIQQGNLQLNREQLAEQRRSGDAGRALTERELAQRGELSQKELTLRERELAAKEKQAMTFSQMFAREKDWRTYLTNAADRERERIDPYGVNGVSVDQFITDPEFQTRVRQQYELDRSVAGEISSTAPGAAPREAPSVTAKGDRRSITFKGQPVSEEQLQAFMAAKKLTREQALRFLASQP